MTTDRQITGKNAEECACRFLENNGYHILERNYRVRTGEIDIIASHGVYLVIVEVKARRSMRRGSPKEAVNFIKQRKIITTASWYLKENGLYDARLRFDVVSLIETNGRFLVEHIENAFQAV